MGNRYVLSTGSNTSPYESRATAATALLTATAIAAAGEKIYIPDTMTDTLTVDTTYALATGVEIISFDTADTAEPPTTLLAGASINGSATLGVDVTFSGKGRLYGLNVISGGSSSSANINLAPTDGNIIVAESCTFTISNNNVGSSINIGSQGGSGNTLVRTRDCTMKFGAVGQGYIIHKLWYDEHSVLADPGGSAPTKPFESVGPGIYEFIGSDISHCAGVLAIAATSPYLMTYYGCKMHASATLLDTTTDDASGDIFAYDCAVGDTHYLFRHHNHRGTSTVSASVVVSSDDGAKYDGTNPWTLVVTGNANATVYNPYYTPWLDVYNETLSVITPYLEIERDSSATAYTNAQVWAEFMAKVSTGLVRYSIFTDRCGLLATAANQTTGTGLANWTGESGTAVSMKLDSGAAFTPAEIGSIRARVAVVGAITVYANMKVIGLAATGPNVERVLGTGFIQTNVTTGGGGSGGGLRIAGHGGLAG